MFDVIRFPFFIQRTGVLYMYRLNRCRLKLTKQKWRMTTGVLLHLPTREKSETSELPRHFCQTSEKIRLVWTLV